MWGSWRDRAAADCGAHVTCWGGPLSVAPSLTRVSLLYHFAVDGLISRRFRPDSTDTNVRVRLLETSHRLEASEPVVGGLQTESKEGQGGGGPSLGPLLSWSRRPTCTIATQLELLRNFDIDCVA